jgi:hypothetical protein
VSDCLKICQEIELPVRCPNLFLCIAIEILGGVEFLKGKIGNELEMTDQT